MKTEEIHLVDPDLWKGGKNELWLYIVWVDKVGPKKSQPAENSYLSHQLCMHLWLIILTELTTHCFNAVNA